MSNRRVTAALFVWICSQWYPPVSDRAKLLSAGEGGAEFREDGDADGHVDRREVLQGTQSSAPQLASGTFVDQRQQNFIGGIPVLSEFNAHQGHMHQAQFNHQGQGQFVHGQVTLANYKSFDLAEEFS